jgi:hypothetical protein
LGYLGLRGVPVARIAPPVVQFGSERAELSNRKGTPSHQDPPEPEVPQ